MSSFTYIIRSINRYAGENTSNCNIALGGLPSFQEFDCEVVGFYVNCRTTDVLQNTIELVSPSLQFSGGFDTRNRRLSSLAFASMNQLTNTLPLSYRIKNFNNQVINFQLLDETGTQMFDDGFPFNQNWILVLKMTPVDNNLNAQM